MRSDHVGTLVGLLPGLGPLATISLLLPLTYSIDTTGALIMLAGIYYRYCTGDVSAITMKIPRQRAMVACIDGYAMTLKGKQGWPCSPPGSPASSGTVADNQCWRSWRLERRWPFCLALPTTAR